MTAAPPGWMLTGAKVFGLTYLFGPIWGKDQQRVGKNWGKDRQRVGKNWGKDRQRGNMEDDDDTMKPAMVLCRRRQL